MAGSMSGYYGNNPNQDPYSGSPIDAQWEGQGQNGQQMRYVVSNNNSPFGGHQGRTLQGYAMNPQTGQWEMSGGGSNFNSTEDYQRFLQEGVGPNGDVNSIANWASQNAGVAYQPRRDPSGISANYQPSGGATGATATGQQNTMLAPPAQGVPQNTTGQGMYGPQFATEATFGSGPFLATPAPDQKPVAYQGPPTGPDGAPQPVKPAPATGKRLSSALAGQGPGYYDQQGQWHKTAFSAKKPTAASGTSTPPPPTTGGTPPPGSGPTPVGNPRPGIGPVVNPPPVNPGGGQPPVPYYPPPQQPAKPPQYPQGPQPRINPGGYTPPIQNATGSTGQPTGGQIGQIGAMPNERIGPRINPGGYTPPLNGTPQPYIRPPNPAAPYGYGTGMESSIPRKAPMTWIGNQRPTVSRNPSGQSLSSALGIAR